MNPKTTIALVFALLLAVIGIYWARSSSSSDIAAPVESGSKNLLDPLLGELIEYEVKVEGRPALVFKVRDAKWHMVEPVSWPGEHHIVDGDAKRIKNLQYVKVYETGDPEAPTPQMTSLDKPTRVIKLTDIDGKSYVVKIGARQALSEKTYVQREGDNRVYLINADLNALMKKDVDEYRNRSIAVFAQNDAVRVEVSGQNAFVLAKSGRDWTIEAPVRGRADAAKIGNLLRAVSSLRVKSFVDDAPATLRPYGLEDPQLLLTIETEKKTPKPLPPPPASAPAETEFDIEHQTIRLALGGMAGDEVFAQMLDDETHNTIFKVAKTDFQNLSPDLESLRDKSVAPIQTARVQHISVETDGKVITLSKRDNQWRIDAQSADAEGSPAEFAAVDDLLKGLGELQAIGFEPKELPTYGLDAPRTVIQIEQEGRLEPTVLRIGGLTPSKTGTYVRNVGEDFIAIGPAAAADSLVISPVAFRSRELLKFARAWASRVEITAGTARRAVDRDGGAWKFSEPVQGKAEMAAVNNILSDLSNLRGRRVVGAAADVAEFGLDRPDARVCVTVESPPMPKAPPTTQTSQPAESQPAEPELQEAPPPVEHRVLLSRHDGKVYAMLEGGATICEVDAKVMQDVEAELFDTRVTSFLPEKAVRLAVKGEETFEFSKNSENLWILDGEASFQTDPAAMTSFLGAVRDVRASRFVAYVGANPAQYGLDQPAIRVTADLEDGGTVSISISGSGPAEGGRYAMMASAPDRVFVIGDEDYAKFNKTIRDFHKAG